MVTCGKSPLKINNNDVLVYPYNNQTNIPVSSFLNGQARSYPISVSVRGKEIKLKDIFVEDGNGKRLINTNSNDFSNDIIHFISDRPLKYNQSYSIEVHFEDKYGDMKMLKTVFKTENKYNEF